MNGNNGDKGTKRVVVEEESMKEAEGKTLEKDVS